MCICKIQSGKCEVHIEQIVLGLSEREGGFFWGGGGVQRGLKERGLGVLELMRGLMHCSSP